MGLSIMPLDSAQEPNGPFFKNSNGEICKELYRTYTYEDPNRPDKIVHIVIGLPGRPLDIELSNEELDLMESFDTLNYQARSIKADWLRRKGHRLEIVAVGSGKYPGPVVKGIYFKYYQLGNRPLKLLVYEKK